jgi:6-phosphofructokinase 1
MASHIILPPEDADENHHQEEEEREELGHDDGERAPPEHPPKAALPFSATCVRISRDSYPNLRALRNASSVSLADAAYVKISEGDFGYVLDDVPHLTDYVPDIPVSAHHRSVPTSRLPPSSSRPAAVGIRSRSGLLIVFLMSASGR